MFRKFVNLMAFGKTNVKPINFLILSLFLVNILCSNFFNVFAQSSTGQIRGTVTDPTGAVVAGASITVFSQETSIKRNTTTNATGYFSVTLLPPGKYRVDINAEGFKQTTLDNVVVRITETSVADAKLEVGSGSSEVIEVTSGSTASVNKESASAGRVVEERTLRQLPLPTRNFQQILTLSPGTSSNITNTAEIGRGDTAINVNGQRSTSNSVTVNGADANGIGTGSTPNLAVPATDALQEFIVQTNQFDASQGRNAGGIIAAITKSGTNEYHGNAYYFLRNTNLNANNFFLNRQGTDRQKNDRNQFGGTFGGPIIKERVFFFGSYQGTRETNGTSLINSLAAIGTAPDLTDDRSLATLTALSKARIPLFGGYLSPVSLKLLQARYPDGSFLIPSGNGATSRILPAESTFDEDQFNANLDIQVSTSNRLNAKYFFANNSTTQALFSQFGLANALQAPGHPADLTANNRILTVTDTHVFSSSIVNEVRFGYNVIPLSSTPTEPFKASDFGIQSPTSGNFPGLPAITLNNFFTAGPSGYSSSKNQAHSYTIGDTVSFTKGNHFIKAGGEYRRNGVDTSFDAFSRGSVTFTGGVAASLKDGVNVRDAFTEFLVAPSLGKDGKLVGLPSVFSIIGPGNSSRRLRSNDYSFFIQDDWKATSWLTLNLGLRYEYFGQFFEKDGNFFTFDDTVPNAGKPGTFNGFFQAGNAKNPLSGITQLSNSLVEPDRNNFAPRVGFALKPFKSDKFVFRGGYGVFFDRQNARAVINQFLNFPGYTLAIIFPGSQFSRPFESPFAPIPSKFPVNPQDKSVFPNGGLPFTASGVPIPVQGVYLGLHASRMPYVQRFSFGFQWEFMKDTELEVTYVGSLGHKFSRLRNVNQTKGPNLVGTGPLSPTLSEVAVQGLGVHLQENTANSNYNSLQLSVTRRLSKGLQGLFAYTFAHSIDNYSGNIASNGTSDVSTDFGDQATFNGSRASSDFDRHHRMIASLVYDLPKWYGGDSKMLKHLFNDWQVASIFTAQTGTPFSVVSTGGPFDQSRASFASGFNGDPNGSGPDRERLNKYFNTNAFVGSSGVGNFGNTGRNILRGPGQVNTDISIVKFFPIAEGKRVEFRTEFFNAFNQVNFANPVSVRSNVNFGRVLSSSTGPRLIQFAFKFNF